MPELNDDVLDESADATLDDIIDEQDGLTDPDGEKDPDDDKDDDGAAAKSKDESDEDDDEDKPKDKGDDEKPKTLGSKVDRGFAKLRREKEDARREADYWKSVAEQARTQPKPQPREEQRQDDQHQPTAEDIEARATEIAESAIARREFLALTNGLKDRLKTGGAEAALERLSNQALTPFEPAAVEALAQAKFPVEVAKALAGNEELFKQFSKARSALERATLIARLDGRIEARREQRKQSDVKPNRQVRGSARHVEKHPDDMDQVEYEAYRKKQGWA